MLIAKNEPMKTTVFDTEVKVLIGALQANGEVPVSATLPTKSAFHRFMTYDTHTEIVAVADQDEFQRFLKECRGKRSLPFTVIRMLLWLPVYILNLVSAIVRGVLGSLVGFGLIGFLIVIVALALSLMVGLYAFVLGAPFLLAGAALNYYERRINREETRRFMSFVFESLSGLYQETEAAAANEGALVPASI
jgi:hypothetical protein